MLKIRGQGREARDRSGRVEEWQRSARAPKGIVGAMWKTGETKVGEKRNKRRQESVGPVDANPDNLENSKEVGRKAQGTRGLSKKCIIRDIVPHWSHLVRGFRNK